VLMRSAAAVLIKSTIGSASRPHPYPNELKLGLGAPCITTRCPCGRDGQLAWRARAQREVATMPHTSDRVDG
jgi:hypothetical protein